MNCYQAIWQMTATSCDMPEFSRFVLPIFIILGISAGLMFIVFLRDVD